MKWNPLIIDTLVRLGWIREQLVADTASSFKLHNTKHEGAQLFITKPKPRDRWGWGRDTTKNGLKFVLDSDHSQLNGGYGRRRAQTRKVRRLVIDASEDKHWERKVYGWVASAAFAYHEIRGAEEVEKQKIIDQRNRTRSVLKQIARDLPVGPVYALVAIYPDGQFALRNGTSLNVQNWSPDELAEKVRGLVRYQIDNGWIPTDVLAKTVEEVLP